MAVSRGDERAGALLRAAHGQRFPISLRYDRPADPRGGKTSADTDPYHGTFVELAPDEKIVEAIEFETRDPGFAGGMRMMTLAKLAKLVE